MARLHRRRVLVVLTVIFSLLFQQVAMAAYACARDVAPPPPTTHCAEMGAMALEAQPEPALCQKHCAPDLSVLTQVPAQDVPALALSTAFPIISVVSAASVVHGADVPIVRSDPPPRLRYCSLQI